MSARTGGRDVDDSIPEPTSRTIGIGARIELGATMVTRVGAPANGC